MPINLPAKIAPSGAFTVMVEGENVGSGATGDIYYGTDGSAGMTRLAVGDNAEVLTLAGGVPTWAAAAAGHTQNTDTGTSSDIFVVDSDSATGKIAIDVTGGGTNHTVTIANTQTTQACTFMLPDMVTGTFAMTSDLSSFITDYTVTEGDVTAQEDHLTINESQISDLGSYLPLGGGTMTGNINMDSGAVSNMNEAKFVERASHDQNLLADTAALYVNTAKNLMFKNVDDGEDGGNIVMTSLADDLTPALSGHLNPGIYSILSSNEYAIGFQAEADVDKTLSITAMNSALGLGLIDFVCDEIVPGAVFRDEDDLDGAQASSTRMASQASIKTYVDAETRFIYHFMKSGFNYGYTAGTKVYGPLARAEVSRDASFPLGQSENITWIAPFDGTLERIQARTSSIAGDVVIGLHIAGDGTDTPNTTAVTSVTVDMAVARTTYTFEYTSNNDFEKGEILMFSFDPENDSNDTQLQITLKLDAKAV